MRKFWGPERIVWLLEKSALFLLVYFDVSHLGKEKDVADVKQVNIWDEDLYEVDEEGKLQLRNSQKPQRERWKFWPGKIETSSLGEVKIGADLEVALDSTRLTIEHSTFSYRIGSRPKLLPHYASIPDKTADQAATSTRPFTVNYFTKKKRPRLVVGDKST